MGAQVAMALVLLVASGLMMRSFQNLRAMDPGFDAASALTFRVGLSARDYPDRARGRWPRIRRVLDRLAALPGVTAVSATSCLPLAEDADCFGNTLFVDGRPFPTNALPPAVSFRAVAGDYFEAMGIRLLRGRGIDAARRRATRSRSSSSTRRWRARIFRIRIRLASASRRAAAHERRSG